MSESDARCDLCDLPLSQCVHGRPPPAPESASKSAPKPVSKAAPKSAPTRKRASTQAAAPSAPAKPVNLRWTPPEVFKPLILTVLQEAGGELDAEDLFLELEILAEDRLRPGDRERTPEGELRWQYAARRARQALIREGLMTQGTPGRWQLARAGRASR